MVSAAVSQDGKALRFASVELRDDIDIVTEAITQDNKALRFASERLRQAEEIHCLMKGDTITGQKYLLFPVVKSPALVKRALPGASAH
jgi:hypothetical protein